jgi:DNA-binding NarL/FixJ family response regulator
MPSKPAINDLSPQLRRIARLLAQGLANAEIAKRMKLAQ